jgi:hypothetical protein
VATKRAIVIYSTNVGDLIFQQTLVQKMSRIPFTQESEYLVVGASQVQIFLGDGPL